jgi:hypothetical protein
MPLIRAEADQVACPVVSTAAGLHHHPAGLARLPKALELRTCHALAFDDSPVVIGDRNLEDLLGQIHGDGYSVHPGLLSQGVLDWRRYPMR